MITDNNENTAFDDTNESSGKQERADGAAGNADNKESPSTATPDGARARAATTRDIVTPRPDAPFGKREWLLTAALLPIAYLVITCVFYYATIGVGFTVGALLLCLASWLYIRFTRGAAARGSRLWLGLTVLSALTFSLTYDTGMTFLRMLAHIALYAYWLCAACGARASAVLSPNAFSESLFTLFPAPFSSMGGTLRGLAGELRGRREVTLTLIALLIAAPILILVVTLLAGADSSFQRMVSGAFSGVKPNLGLNLFKLLLTVIFCFYLLSQTLSLARDDRAPSPCAAVRRCLPRVIPCVVISLLCAVYLTYFYAQIQSILSVAAARREGFSYSEYARQGFFQLCGVCGVNLCVTLLADYLTEDKNNTLRALLTALCACTLLLAASAMYQMALYVGVYGLTTRRIFVSCLIVFFALTFSLLLLKQWRKGLPVFRACALTFVIGFLLTGVVNPARISANYNADRYLRGTLKEFDFSPYRWCAPYAAADAAKRILNESDDEKVKDRLAYEYEGYLSPDSLLEWNYEEARGERLLKDMVEERRRSTP